MIMISPSAVHSTKQSSYCWQKATNSSSVMGTRSGFKITGAIDSKSSTTNCIRSVYCGERFKGAPLDIPPGSRYAGHARLLRLEDVKKSKNRGQTCQSPVFRYFSH